MLDLEKVPESIQLMQVIM